MAFFGVPLLVVIITMYSELSTGHLSPQEINRNTFTDQTLEVKGDDELQDPKTLSDHFYACAEIYIGNHDCESLNEQYYEKMASFKQLSSWSEWSPTRAVFITHVLFQAFIIASILLCVIAQCFLDANYPSTQSRQLALWAFVAVFPWFYFRFYQAKIKLNLNGVVDNTSTDVLLAIIYIGCSVFALIQVKEKVLEKVKNYILPFVMALSLSAVSGFIYESREGSDSNYTFFIMKYIEQGGDSSFMLGVGVPLFIFIIVYFSIKFPETLKNDGGNID